MKFRSRLFHLMLPFAVFVCAAIAPFWCEAASLPSGFAETQVTGPFQEAVGVVFEPNGRIYVWERLGRVWFRDVGDPNFTLLLDISEEVGAWLDHGLLGFA